MRKARQNKQNKVRLVKKKLYINNIQYIQEYITNYQNHQRPRSWETPRDFSRDRTFKRSANCGRYNNGWAPRQTFVGKAVNFASPNMYTHLPRYDDLVNTAGRSENRHLSHHDKTNKMTCAPSEDSRSAWASARLIRVFARRSMGNQGLTASLCGQ